MADDELVEKMASAYFFEDGVSTLDDAIVEEKTKQSIRKRMLRVLAIASPVIRNEALEEAISACDNEHLISPNGEGDEAYDRAVADCIDAISFLKSNGAA